MDRAATPPVTVPLASQRRSSRVHTDNEVSGFQNIDPHTFSLDLENGLGFEDRSLAVAVDMPRYPHPARVHQARRPIIQVPEPRESVAFFNTTSLAGE